MRTYLLLYLLVTTAITAMAAGADTTGRPVYYEPAPEGMLRFFYDDRYYLADKACSFRAIERIAKFDFNKQVFVGEFVDFNLSGRAILRGNYENGKKEGKFTAYHPNGERKWEVTFVQDVPRGIWAFYYPDGKPLLELEYGPRGTIIRNFWDTRGRQQVTDGNGKYAFEIAADGYNEYGYVRYNRSGRVVNGLPHGNWIVEYVFEDGEKAGAGHEYYRDGQFIRGYETFTDETFDGTPRYRLYPVEFFDRATILVSKACTIDEYSGFTQYLEKYFERWFATVNAAALASQRIELAIAVDETGTAQRIEAIQTFPSAQYASLLLSACHGIEFWFPSYADGEYTADTLTLTAEVAPDPDGQKLHFYNIQIRREKGY
ncbi:toxin-antitoxin system YwqK family antitoxin [Parapedobacter lycopersici]|uniref:toxin-antitoxin system YwqK family antitoxin n=1 Tax=Parapedobacter lycopersici TaxID=1864939 RepID=UPI00214D9E45|nr:hypothetical protein [Parapedobacter lycopersici]